MRASEIAGLNLDVDLTILSACSSAVESSRGEEPLSGLAAGSREVLATHWVVDNASAQSLVSEFARRKYTGHQWSAKALSDAQALVRQNPSTSHPVYWAAYDLIGLPGPGAEAPAAPPQQRASLAPRPAPASAVLVRPKPGTPWLSKPVAAQIDYLLKEAANAAQRGDCDGIASRLRRIGDLMPGPIPKGEAQVTEEQDRLRTRIFELIYLDRNCLLARNNMH